VAPDLVNDAETAAIEDDVPRPAHDATLKGSSRNARKAETTGIIEQLGEADVWLRGEPSPDVVTHIGKTVADASHAITLWTD
jgi:hypothetical protein